MNRTNYNNFYHLDVFLFFFLSLFMQSCRNQDANEIKLLVLSMTLEEKSSQVLMTGIDGKETFSLNSKKRFTGTVPGAILLFRYNIADTPQGLANYLDDCSLSFSALDPRLPVLFAIDHEGGDVFRTGKVTSFLPSAQTVALEFSETQAEKLYSETGAQLSALGIRMNLAPVVETLTLENSTFLGNRSFSVSPKIVNKYAASAIAGYRSSGLATTLKHFPGNADSDPHSGLPVLNVSKAEFELVYIRPFQLLMRQNPDAVLVSHVVVPVIDPGVPFCLSRAGVTDILRKSLGFKGVIITDDIAMAAIKKSGYNSSEAAILALKAGCDMILTLDQDIKSVAGSIASEARANPQFAKELDKSVGRILELKYKTGLVKTAAESYRVAGQKKIFTEKIFNEKVFFEARKNAELILEGHDDQ